MAQRISLGAWLASLLAKPAGATTDELILAYSAASQPLRGERVRIEAELRRRNVRLEIRPCGEVSAELRGMGVVPGGVRFGGTPADLGFER